MCGLAKLQQIFLGDMQIYNGADVKTIVNNTDMPDAMQRKAIESVQTALRQYKLEKDMAAYIKREFDKQYNPTWHCIVGRNFAR